jgi:hypothetical protein
MGSPLCTSSVRVNSKAWDCVVKDRDIYVHRDMRVSYNTAGIGKP